jgi:hypothetical protein
MDLPRKHHLRLRAWHWFICCVLIVVAGGVSYFYKMSCILPPADPVQRKSFMTTDSARMLDTVLCIGRPVHTEANSAGTLFRVTPNGRDAYRVAVTYGRASADVIEIVSGLNAGDRVILSDMSMWDAVDRVKIRSRNMAGRREIAGVFRAGGSVGVG